MQGFGVVGLGLVGILLAVAWSSPLAAKEVSSAELATARRLFAEATALEASSDWNAAVSKLKSAVAIKETPGLRYHLAHCEELLGALVAASFDYERAAELIRGGAPAPDVEPLLPLAQRRIDSRIAKLDIVVPAGTSALAEVDGRSLPRSALGTSLRLDPGPHRVVVRANGEADYLAELSLGTGERRTLKVFFHDAVEGKPSQPPSSTAFVPAAPSEPAGRMTPGPVQPDEGSSSAVRTSLLIGEAALTLAGLGVGIGYAFARDDASAAVVQANADVDALASGNSQDCSKNPDAAACKQLASASEHFDQVVRRERVGFITAGTAAGLMIATWVFWPASPRRATVALSPSPGGALLCASGAF
jgi:hypothetical protein